MKEAMNHLHDIKIAGSGVLHGGKYNTVKISGSGKIHGDVEAEEMKISGSGKIDGMAKVKHFKVSGSGKVEGDVQGETCNVSGSGKVEGTLNVMEFKLSGSFSCRDLKCETLISSGSLRVENNVEAEQFSAKGGVSIGGLLNANRIHIVVGGRSHVKEIGGEYIIIESNNSQKEYGIFSKLLAWLFRGGKYKGVLAVEMIEGTNVSLENTEAKVVRGDKVFVRRNCIIDQVEYSGSLEVDPMAVVKNQVRVE